MTYFHPSFMFSDHMVLRHSRLNPVWGEAPAGAKVTVTLGAETASCTADADGQWRVWLLAPGPGEITTLTLSCGNETIVFEDVACGEVWLAGGQSNMEQSLMCMADARPWAESADTSNVRIKRIPRRCTPHRQCGWHFYVTESYDEPWMLADKESACKCSAIGYVFAAKLAKQLNMPVGIVECNWGGTKIQCWLPTEELLAHEDTRKDLEIYLASREALGERAHETFVDYQRSIRQALINEPDYLERNLNDPLNYLIQDRNIAYPPSGAEGDPQMPGALYDYMVARVAPYGLSGLIWYQGEANTGTKTESARYFGLFGRMLAAWRAAFADPSLPFLTCQIAPFDASMYWKVSDWPGLRASQQRCADEYANVSMAVLLDVGMERNIHPLYKEPVAERLCRLALSDVYGLPAHSRASRPVDCARLEDAVLVFFDGPVELRAGELPVLRTASGEVPCTVTLPSPNTLCLKPDNACESITGVSYAQKSWLVPGLFDSDGLPVAPFEFSL